MERSSRGPSKPFHPFRVGRLVSEQFRKKHEMLTWYIECPHKLLYRAHTHLMPSAILRWRMRGACQRDCWPFHLYFLIGFYFTLGIGSKRALINFVKTYGDVDFECSQLVSLGIAGRVERVGSGRRWGWKGADIRKDGYRGWCNLHGIVGAIIQVSKHNPDNKSRKRKVRMIM